MASLQGPRPTPSGEGAPGLDWAWVGTGVLLGSILVWTLVSVVEHEPPRPDVAVLIGGLTFVLTGVLLGYHSPGETVAEAAVAGGLVGLLAGFFLTVQMGYAIPLQQLVGGWTAAFLLSVIGGWVGEILQGTVHASEDTPTVVSWPWIVVGTVLGVVLNGYSIFVVRALLDPPGTVLLASFVGSFVLAGFFVGFLSPGVTILEPAFAALLIVGIDAALVLVIFRAPFPPLWLMLGGSVGFLFALFGGWLGERTQQRLGRRRVPSHPA